MPGVFIGSTELTTVGDIKIGGTDVQEVYVGATKVFPVGGLPATDFDYNPVADGALPGTSTYTRNSSQYYYDGTQYQVLAADEIPNSHVPFLGSAKGFLWEPASSSLVTDPEDLSSVGGWDNLGTLTESDLGVSDIGLSTWRLDAGTSGGPHVTVFSISGTGDIAVSIRARADTGQYLTIRLGQTFGSYAVYDLIGGTVTESSVGLAARMTPLDNDWFICKITTTPTTNRDFVLGFSDSATPGDPQPSFTASNETIDVSIPQVEPGLVITTPMIGFARVAASFTDTSWPSEASAIVDMTVTDRVLSSEQVNMLGFDDDAGDNLAIIASDEPQLLSGGINATFTASTSYESERHGFGMSLKANEGILTDDELNDDTDSTGTPSGGTMFVGSASDLTGLPSTYHRIRRFAEAQSLSQLRGLL